ncbi:MAG: trehalose-phosphatase [Actinomycetota bacterium]|nr:trehalose-phosphatase [Actinomycetota bacterium]
MPADRDAGPRLAPGSLVATDFDGTLAPIVAEPSAARPIDGAVQTLTELSARGHEVAVVSGRPLSFLVGHLPEQLTLVGLYGLEMRRHGELVEHPLAPVWRPVMAEAAAAASAEGPDGMVVEFKGLSITLHYRTRPELAEQVDACAARVAERAGLLVRPARRSVELHPPIDEDKGSALRRLAEGSDGTVIYLGDDVGDLPAFDALDDLAVTGRSVWKIGVHSDELSPRLRDRADVMVPGPAGSLALLRSLLG